MADEVKGFKPKLLELLPKILPILALAGAGLALIFTFLIGVSSNAEGAANYFIYHFFDGKYINSVSSLQPEEWADANRTVMLAGILITIFGLIAVLVFAGLTVYKAVLKYAFKKQCSVELFAVLTFLSYAVFSSLFYAVNCCAVSTEGVVVRTGYNAATIAGLTLTSVVFASYYALKCVVNTSYFKNKLNIVKFSYSVLRIAFIVVLLGLVSAPLVSVSLDGLTVKSNLIQLLICATQGGNADKLSSLGSAASIGLLIIAAISVMLVWLLTSNLNSLLSDKKKKNDIVFYIIVFVLLFFLLIIVSVAGGFYSDVISGLLTKSILIPEGESVGYIRTAGGFHIEIVLAVKNANGEIEVIKELLGTVNIAVSIPWAFTVLGVLMVVLIAVYNANLHNFERLIEKAEKAKAAKKAENTAEKADGDVDNNVILEVKNLCKHFVIGTDFFGRPTKTLKAVDDVSFKLEKGKTLGIVGESGCGKTTMGRTVLRLHDVTSGEVWFKGEKISALSNREFDKLRPNMQMIFQDPYASLSPRLTVGEIIGEAVKQHKLVSKSEYHDYILSVMKMCGLQPHYFERYPHEFSGGQRQRICIARALALKPELVVCDEPVSALDVSIQAQIINMLIELRKTLGLTYVFISHDLSVVKHISDNVGVMYLGSMVEYGTKDAIFENTLHPYTRALFSAVPIPDPHVKMNRIILKGDIPSPVNPPKGCKFHTRCESCMDICGRVAPIYKEVEEGHFCACHLYNTEEDTALLERRYEEEQKLAEKAAEQTNKSFKDKLKNLFKKSAKNDGEKTEVDDVPKE